MEFYPLHFHNAKFSEYNMPYLVPSLTIDVFLKDYYRKCVDLQILSPQKIFFNLLFVVASFGLEQSWEFFIFKGGVGLVLCS